MWRRGNLSRQDRDKFPRRHKIRLRRNGNYPWRFFPKSCHAGCSSTAPLSLAARPRLDWRRSIVALVIARHFGAIALGQYGYALAWASILLLVPDFGCTFTWFASFPQTRWSKKVFSGVPTG